ncbi:ABC transporter permease [Parabacteroides sp. OttesenSCG-928-G07]|nr:ABC transporter permease [Parabacteroides sp. OttesenSCG-928-G07]
MNKLGLIIKREYLRRVSKKSFIILTLLMPFMITGLIFVPLWLSSIKGSEVRQVVIIDQTGKYASLFTDTESYSFIHSQESLDKYRSSDDKSAYAILNITGDLLDNPRAATIYSEKQISQDLSRIVNQTLSRYLEDEKLASYNIPGLKEMIKESQISFNVQTIKWSEDGSEKISSAMVASIVGMVFTMIVYMFIMIYGAMVMQGVMEEKTNRIVELMISSVRPFDLMMGKIIGIGFVGLTQIFIWGLLTATLVTGAGFIFGTGNPATMQSEMMAGASGIDTAAIEASVSTDIMAMIQSINLTEIGIFFVVFFVGGYLLYASLFAAFGSAVDNQEDTQQFIAPITILMVFALYAGIYSMENPDGPLAFWCSIIPFTSPIVMMVRIPFEIPLWEKLLSVVLLYASAIGITWFSAKIYRVGILMYGKKPSIKEMIKWIRF